MTIYFIKDVIWTGFTIHTIQATTEEEACSKYVIEDVLFKEFQYYPEEIIDIGGEHPRIVLQVEETKEGKDTKWEKERQDLRYATDKPDPFYINKDNRLRLLPNIRR